MSDLLIKPLIQPHSQKLLVVFHHAGGMALSYRSWIPAMGPDWQVALFEVPGRGLNRDSPAPKSFTDLFPDLLDEIEELADERSITLFGHSMGGLIAYETALRLGSVLDTLVISSIGPKAYERFMDNEETERFYAQMEDPAVLSENIRNRPDALEIFRQNLRQDADLLRKWRPSGTIKIRTLIMGGREDDLVPVSALESWRDYCSFPQIKTFDGGHFYWEQNLKSLAQILDELPRKRERLL